MNQFNNKTALVIGGTSGIGHSTVLSLLEDGAVVHVVGRNPKKISDAPNLIKHRVDITNSVQVQSFISEIKTWTNLDLLS